MYIFLALYGGAVMLLGEKLGWLKWFLYPIAVVLPIAVLSSEHPERILPATALIFIGAGFFWILDYSERNMLSWRGEIARFALAMGFTAIGIFIWLENGFQIFVGFFWTAAVAMAWEPVAFLIDSISRRSGK